MTTPTVLDVQPEPVSPWEGPAAGSPEPAAGTRSPAIVVAASASAGAGLVHAAAAGAHASDHRGLALGFGVAALLQLAWAALAWQRGASSRRPVVLAGVALHVAAAGVWAVSRTAGIDWFPGLEEVESVGLQDATAVALQAIAVLGALAALFVPSTARPSRPAAAFGAVLLLAALPGMVTPHGHSDGREGEQAHGHEAQVIAADDGLPDVPGVTPAQRKKAAKLIVDTKASLARFPTVAAAEAAGYRSIGDSITGFEHFVNAAYLTNPAVVDPQQPESLVFKVAPDGTRTLASAMYILPPGKTMADVPDIAGAMTQWHDHQNLCWDASGVRLAGVVVNGRCTPGGTFRATPPMLHVWVVDHECGPFAGIEGTAHSGSCLQHGH